MNIMNKMRRILGKVTFSCMSITEMVESKERNKLSFGERLRYNMHLAFCKACRSYEKQSALIGKAIGRLMSESSHDIKTMDENSRQKILDKLKKN